MPSVDHWGRRMEAVHPARQHSDEEGQPLVVPLADKDGAYMPIHFVDQDSFPPGMAP